MFAFEYYDNLRGDTVRIGEDIRVLNPVCYAAVGMLASVRYVDVGPVRGGKEYVKIQLDYRSFEQHNLTIDITTDNPEYEDILIEIGKDGNFLTKVDEKTELKAKYKADGETANMTYVEWLEKRVLDLEWMHYDE